MREVWLKAVKEWNESFNIDKSDRTKITGNFEKS